MLGALETLDQEVSARRVGQEEKDARNERPLAERGAGKACNSGRWFDLEADLRGLNRNSSRAETARRYPRDNTVESAPSYSSVGPRKRCRRITRSSIDKGEAVLTDTNRLTTLELDQYDEYYCYGMQIREMDHPYLLSPPDLPVTGATTTTADTVKVTAFHGITYSHQGLTDPAIMPEYVRQVRENHCAILRYATLDPELPRWGFSPGRGLRTRSGTL